MNNSTNHHRLYLVLGWLAPLAATLAWAAVTATHMDHRSPHSESWVASVCLRKILFCPSVSCCQSVISSARRDPFYDDGVVDISKYLKFIYFYIQLLLSSYYLSFLRSNNGCSCSDWWLAKIVNLMKYWSSVKKQIKTEKNIFKIPSRSTGAGSDTITNRIIGYPRVPD